LLGDNAAVLAKPSGERPAPPCDRADAALIAERRSEIHLICAPGIDRTGKTLYE